jgi:hypothetical protein
MLNLLKRTMTYRGFEPETFGLAVSKKWKKSKKWNIAKNLASRFFAKKYISYFEPY